MFSSQIPEGNEHWEVYLDFMEIVDMPFSWLPYLHLKIKMFLEHFKACYTNSTVTPKMHYMVHYPRIIEQLRPLAQFWCMRFEAKHQYFKALASRTMNFY